MLRAARGRLFILAVRWYSVSGFPAGLFSFFWFFLMFFWFFKSDGFQCPRPRSKECLNSGSGGFIKIILVRNSTKFFFFSMQKLFRPGLSFIWRHFSPSLNWKFRYWEEKLLKGAGLKEYNRFNPLITSQHNITTWHHNTISQHDITIWHHNMTSHHYITSWHRNSAA